MKYQINIAVCHNHYRAGSVLDTVIDVSDAEWDEIYMGWLRSYIDLYTKVPVSEAIFKHPHQYIKELVELKLAMDDTAIRS
jgi:hypothetical protein